MTKNGCSTSEPIAFCAAWGACVQVGRGQLQVDDIKNALEAQKSLKKSLSAPPTGLFLTDVKYPI